MPLSEEQLREIVVKVKIPKLERTNSARVLGMVDRKLSVEGHRDRVARDIKDLANAERESGGKGEQWASERYYRQQHDALTEAERWANGGK